MVVVPGGTTTVEPGATCTGGGVTTVVFSSWPQAASPSNARHAIMTKVRMGNLLPYPCKHRAPRKFRRLLFSHHVAADRSRSPGYFQGDVDGWDRAGFVPIGWFNGLDVACLNRALIDPAFKARLVENHRRLEARHKTDLPRKTLAPLAPLFRDLERDAEAVLSGWGSRSKLEC